MEGPQDDKMLMARYKDYNMTKEQALDAYNVLTNMQLREQYDKNNVYYNEEDFVKKKGKSISQIDKWLACLKAVGGFAPFVFMILMSGTSATGR